MIGTNDASFQYKLLLTDRQFLSLCKAFTQLSKITQSCGFLGRFLGQLMKVGLSLMNNALTLLATSVLIPLG